MCLYTLDEHGFYGKKFVPVENKYPNKVMIAFTGSDGSFSLACRLAEYYSGIGITCVAVCYWNISGLPLSMVNVPIESVQEAALLLQKEGFEKIGVCGISKGGELALLSGSLLSEINCVIALAPMHVACTGFKGMKMVEASSWSFKGKEIPYTKGEMNLPKVMMQSIKSGEVTMNFIYEELLKNTNSDSVIAVEKIKGPILLVSPEIDLMWPSKFACEQVVKRLREHDFKYEVKHLNYKYASHLIFPFDSRWHQLYKMERKYKTECQNSRVNLDQQIQQFIEQW